MDAGLCVRTKQFIEFGLKISFTPCFFLLEHQQVIYFVLNSRIRRIMQCSAAVNEIHHSSGEVQQITHKGSIQLTILIL